MRPIATDVDAAWSLCVYVHVLITAASRAEMAEPIEMPFGAQIRVGPRDRVSLLDGVHIGATWQIRLGDPCAAAIRPYVALL